ncbi:diaminopimelate epimerase [Nocardioides sp. BP30]|uniref:diaminopimelate epimerase n=1 Tax=Nocardioides sp. BP30 TaxID=3036374 RepID=UPI002468BA7E|nr:diaminopimelate epimerase [Nocardioides sp. BP30]WGL51820.1 diaminopimelate epimerase [Nocardioides sp. BP30]
MSGSTYDFVKGHGTENDFVLLPDPDGSVHGPLSDERVRALCDRHAGIGGDGVLRVIRTAAYAADWPGAPATTAEGEWFMDYRNADGSIAEMCGNGTRVFAAYLRAHHRAGEEIVVATRAGDKRLTFDGELWTVDLGEPLLLGWSEVSVGESTWKARHVDMGNPHAVALVEEPVAGLDLGRQPAFDAAIYPHGVNIELVERLGEGRLRMRVHERGVGETRSCGTGIGATAVATMEADGHVADGATYVVDVPGGRLTVTWTADDRVLLTGPAALVATGTTGL